ncbi:hypothetical protein Hanom_Chr12g01103161 [Helianthus anomalus]
MIYLCPSYPLVLISVLLHNASVSLHPIIPQQILCFRPKPKILKKSLNNYNRGVKRFVGWQVQPDPNPNTAGPQKSCRTYEPKHDLDIRGLTRTRLVQPDFF